MEVEKNFLGGTKSGIISFLPEVPDLKGNQHPSLGGVEGGFVGEILQDKHILTFRVRKTISGVQWLQEALEERLMQNLFIFYQYMEQEELELFLRGRQPSSYLGRMKTARHRLGSSYRETEISALG